MKSNTVEIKQKVNRLCFAVFIFIGILNLLQVLWWLISPIENLFSRRAFNISESLFSGFSYLAAYLASILVFKTAFFKEYKRIGLETKIGKHPFATVFAGLGFTFTASHIMQYFGYAKSSVFTAFHDEDIVLAVITSALIPAFFEELFFRGLIMTNLMPLGKNFSIITSGIIFGLIHGNHNQILFATLSGFLFGIIYAKSGSLWLCIIIHLFNNLISVAETYTISSLDYYTSKRLCGVIEASVILIGVISVIYLLFCRKIEKKQVYDTGVYEYEHDSLKDSGRAFTLKEYVKGLLCPGMIIFIIYVALNEALYVRIF